MTQKKFDLKILNDFKVYDESLVTVAEKESCITKRKPRKRKRRNIPTESVTLQSLEEQEKRKDWFLSTELGRITEEEKYWYRIHKKSSDEERAIILTELRNDILDEAMLKNLNNYFF